MKEFIFNRQLIRFNASNQSVKTVVVQKVCSDEPRLLNCARFMGNFNGDDFVIWRSTERSKESALKIYGSFGKEYKYCELQLRVSKDLSALIVAEIFVFSIVSALFIFKWLMPISVNIKIFDVLWVILVVHAVLLIGFLYDKWFGSKIIVAEFEDEIRRFLPQSNKAE